jgi:hypothetical protein
VDKKTYPKVRSKMDRWIEGLSNGNYKIVEFTSVNLLTWWNELVGFGVGNN